MNLLSVIYANAEFVTLLCPKFFSVVGETAMNAEPKHKPKEKGDSRKGERQHQENALDDALKNTFPASDPVSAEQPTPPAVDRDRAKT